MDFLARYARELPYADADRLAAMGHSYGAQAALAWCAEPASSVRAAVSIDSTVEYVDIDYPGFAKLKAHFQDRKRNLRAAILRFASRENKPKFATLERYLKFAPRYEARVAGLDHNDYLTHGAIRPPLMPDRWPDAKKARALRLSYDRVCAHVFQFLDAALKQRRGAREFLQRSLRGEGLDEGFALRYRPAAPAPPTARQLAALVEHHGADKAAALLRSCRDDVEHGIFGGAGDLLIANGHLKEALDLFTRAAKIFPKSMAVQSNRGNALALSGDAKGAMAAYRKAMELIPRATDDPGVRARWKAELGTKLKKLGADQARPRGSLGRPPS
jgi:tetratricopeptide (TPR) repeat protein